MSGATDGTIYNHFERALDRMDGIVIVLSWDTFVCRETAQLIQNLQIFYPELLHPNRAIVLMNKDDMLFEVDEDVVTEKKGEIIAKLNLFPEYYSAAMGLESRICKADPSTVTKRQFKRLLTYADEKKDYAEQIEESSDFNLENVKKMANLLEHISNIKVVENSINFLLPGLKKRNTVAVLRKLLKKLESHQHLSQRVQNLELGLTQVQMENC